MAGSEAVKRGSEKLISYLAHKGETITTDDLRSALDLTKETQFKILRWWIKGIPPADIVLNATLEVSQQHVGEVIQKILNAKELALGIEVFPYGIPNPDVAIVNFTNVPEEVGG